ncbi:HAD-IIIC family phosphatase [Ruminococcaceae bacterium OttesenSCG-928-A16]|nr:HAD-IIIC family phosphatase [Ruminococcaceae bacterium OttesenSCG-928-A16]
MEMLQYPFDGAQVLQKKRALKKQLLQTPGLIDKKIAIVGGSTVGEIKNMLELFLLNLGIRPTFWQGEYALFYQNVVFDDGSLAAFAPDILYIHTSNHNLRLWPNPADTPTEAAEKLNDEFAYFEAVWQAAEKLGCPVVQNNFEDPLWRNFGNLDASDMRGRVHHARAMNTRMAEYASSHPGFYIHDLAYLAALHGLDAWCDISTWYAYKYCCAVEFIPALGHSLASQMGSLFGRTKKALALDLDNTLWGGVVGEVGPEGIELGSETPTGMAYAELQQYLKMLAQRGVLLNVASKNEEAAAESGFARADSPLKREDFLCFEANWGPKTHSIAQMATTLNILPDSFVFMDDNPAERELVMQELPEVTVPPVAVPEQSIALLDRAGYFEVSGLSADDIKRGEMYKQNAQRTQLEHSFGNYEDYLKSLEMTAEIVPFNPQQLERVTQLINKTNQFNLTTRRYTNTETEHCMQSDAFITLSGKLVDKFGDNGITSAIIGSIQGQTLNIDLWIMSCRVFKRHLEYAMFDALVQAAKQRGITTITGRWLPTAKNLLVKDFYATIGFTLVSETEQERVFSYNVPASYQPKNTVMKVEG